MAVTHCTIHPEDAEKLICSLQQGLDDMKKHPDKGSVIFIINPVKIDRDISSDEYLQFSIYSKINED